MGPFAVGDYFWAAVAAGSTTYGTRRNQIHAFDLVVSTTTYDVTSLTSGTAYEVQVRAGNTHGDGNWSPTATATPS